MTKIQDFSDLAKESSKLLHSSRIKTPSQRISVTSKEFNTVENEKEKLRPVNVDNYLQLQKDILVSDTINSVSKKNRELLEQQFEDRLEKEWIRNKDRILEDLNEQSMGDIGLFSELKGTSSSADVSKTFYDESSSNIFATPPRCSTLRPVPFGKFQEIHPVVQVYASVISELNEYRLSGTDYDILGKLNAATQRSPTGSKTLLFALLTDVLNKPGTAQIFSSQRKLVQAGKLDDASVRSFKQSIASGGIRFYARKHWTDIEQAIQNNVRVAALGGRPTVHDKVTGYIRILSEDSGAAGSFLNGLEVKPELRKLPNWSYPVWCHLYHLLRGGKYFEMADWARARVNEGIFKSIEDILIVEAMEEWRLQEPPRLVTPSLKAKLVSKWNTVYAPLIAENKAFDPYKACILRILAQCGDWREPAASSVSYHSLQSSLDDRLWFKLHFVDENVGFSGSELDEKSSLPRLDMMVHESLLSLLGTQDDSVFDESLFHGLLCCGQFERGLAYAFMSQSASFGVQLDAIHAAIALSYFDCLQLPLWPQRAELLSGKSKLNIAYLLSNYARQLWAHNLDIALQYLLLINIPGLYSHEKGESPYSQFTYHCIVRCALVSDEHLAYLFGPISASLESDGRVFRYAKLLSLGSREDYFAKIVRRTADVLLEQGRSDEDMSRVAQLYYRANDVSRVLTMVNRRLSSDISDRCKPLLAAARRAAQLDLLVNTSTMFPISPQSANGEPKATIAEKQAAQVFDFLSKQATDDFDKSSSETAMARSAASMLLSFSRFVSKLERGEWALAFEKVSSLKILPIIPQIDTFASPMEAVPSSGTPLSRNAFGRTDQNALYLVLERVSNLKNVHPLVIKLLPNLLVLTMYCLQQLCAQAEASPYGDSSSLLQYWKKQAENIMAFDGNSHFRMPSEAYALINQLYVHIS